MGKLKIKRTNKQIPIYKRGKFSDKTISTEKKELIEILAGEPNGPRVERIISQGEASPLDFWYDQKEDEWVMLTAGTAIIVFEDRRVRLRASDWLLIPAHCRHRVASVSKNAMWLAVFLKST